ncbi:MAG: hypothetical protein IPM46_05385 [Flavobacteriales bacterium]|nr:hypothetical protein [Flavobacteriales bacterium]
MGSILALHAIAGFIALVVAPLAMLARKGGNWHRRWGKAYFWAMAVVATSAIVIGVLKSNWLMAMVAVFSFQMIASGYRALYLKRLHEGQQAAWPDRFIMGAGILVNGALFMWGVIHLMLGHKESGPVIFTVFGTIGLLFVWRDFQRFHKMSHDKREWLYAHMVGFLGGYIATVSAFSAVNLEMIRPMWLQWLWPTIIGAPLIALWTGYYRKRFAGGKRSHDLFDLRIGRRRNGARREG